MNQTILVGHVIDRLKELEEKSIHSCVTSPPYYLARRYDTEPVIWGGNPNHEHGWKEVFVSNPNTGGGVSFKQDTNPGSRCSEHYSVQSGEDSDPGRGKGAGSGGRLARKKGGKRGFTTFSCSCGAWKGELGHEPLADCLAWARGESPCSMCFVCHMRMVFAEVYRVLRDDGTLFLNLDDSMSGTGGGQKQTGKASYRAEHWPDRPVEIPGIRKGSKIGIPERVAFALQADGWILRSAIVWAKISPICESTPAFGWFWERHRIQIKKQKKVTEGKQARISDTASGLNARWKEYKYKENEDFDMIEGIAALRDGGSRPEYILCPGCEKCEKDNGYVLKKFSGRPTEAYEFIFLLCKKMGYYWDTVNAKVPYSPSTLPQKGKEYKGKSKKNYIEHGANDASDTKRRVVDSLSANGGRNLWNYYVGENSLADFWLVASEPLKDEHYAAFPTRIPRDCIKVGTSDKGCCPKCGSQYARVIERIREDHGVGEEGFPKDEDGPEGMARLHRRVKRAREEGEPHGQTLGGFKPIGWKETCKCHAGDPVPPVVLDPFLGSGTTLLVAEALGRRGKGIERKQEFADIAVRRFKKAHGMMFSYLETVEEGKLTSVAKTTQLPLFGEE